MSDATEQIEEYMNPEEELSYSLSHRPIGLTSWVLSLFGYGKTYWYVTNQRVVEYRRMTGGFHFQDVPIEKISSTSYGRRFNYGLLAVGATLLLLGMGAFLGDLSTVGLVLGALGAIVVAVAYFNRRQVLELRASGGVVLSLTIARGESVDDFLWYINTEREKRRQ
jgi:hypothetical protein